MSTDKNVSQGKEHMDTGNRPGQDKSDEAYPMETVGQACSISDGAAANAAMPRYNMDDPVAFRAAVIQWVADQKNKGNCAS